MNELIFNIFLFIFLGSDSSLQSSGRKIAVLRPDDDTFTNFFKFPQQKDNNEALELTVDDLDLVTRESQNLLIHKRTVHVKRKHATSRNPVKALTARSDVLNEYTEVLTGVAEREKRRLNIEKCKYN